ncbi:MAG TPA: sugar ABC transporter ATP-binding protein [Streptosporangiaceae bacterium]|nr:sugar ABC transporter ATP-binding protein [Streptosporangiaceae bacterium]
MSEPARPAAEAAGIHKQFGSTQALRGVDLTLRPGQCLGLVGRNGAGKSTLVSILSGILPADAGEVRFDGEPAPPFGAIDAWRGRIATVFQHSMVVPDLTVAENVFLGRQPLRRGRRLRIVDWRRMREQTRRVMAEWGFEIDANEPCANLTVEQRQVVEIARALAAGTRCLLLDEPTSALERGAVQRLFERIRQLTASGVAVLYISHHLEEVFEICQDVAVVRDGEMVLTAPTASLSTDDLVTAMVGEQSGTAAAARHTGAPGARAPQEPPRLAAEHVSLASPGISLIDVSLEVRPGERVGLTGLRGSGATTLARIVAGAAAPDAGRVMLDGRELPAGRRDTALRAGVGYIPEDRQREGFVAALSVAENATMTITDLLARFAGVLLPRVRAGAAAPLARQMSIVSAGLGQPVGELSGGNQQKVTVARALARDPKLIVAITPTRGVDVASKELLLRALADATGTEERPGLLLASDELDDLVICDRVIVMVRGEVFTEFTAPPFDREALIAATEGLARNGHNGQEPST